MNANQKSAEEEQGLQAKKTPFDESLKEAAIKMAEWFLPVVGLTYACGFLIVFTFLKSYGISTVEFIEAKYIYTGSLFLLSGITIIIPFRWAYIGLERWYKNEKNRNWISELKVDFLHGRAGRIIRKMGRKYFLTDWQISDEHGLHGTFPVTGSATCMMWCFLILLTFARPDFSYSHPKLIFWNLLFPLLIFGLAIPVDWIKGEYKESPIMSGGARFLKFYWTLLGLFLLVWFFLFRDSFDSRLRYFILLYFLIPFIVIVITWCRLYRNRPHYNGHETERQRRMATSWAFFAIQWMLFLMQLWVFLRVIIYDNLRISLREVFVGENWHLIQFPWVFPRGAFSFVLLFLLMIFFAVRTFYRIKRIPDINLRNIISIFCFLGVMFYFSILSFARNIYPYIPAVKGGGDYTASIPIHLTFDTNFVTSIPQPIMNDSQSNNLILLDANNSFVYLAETNDAGGPMNWRSTTNKPNVYEIRREAIISITYQNSAATNSKVSANLIHKTQVGDKGIDGRIFPVGTESAGFKEGDLTLEECWYPIQVKQKDKAGWPDIDAFETAMRRSKRDKGFFVAFDYSADALWEIDRYFKDDHAVIIPLTVKEILDGQIARKLA